MNLTQEQINKLNECAKNKTKIYVQGKNALGQDFATIGYVAQEDESKFGKTRYVSKNGFAMFLGQYKTDSMGNKVKCFVPLICQPISKNYYLEGMYVLKVATEQGETIFENNFFGYSVFFKQLVCNNLVYSFFGHIV